MIRSVDPVSWPGCDAPNRSPFAEYSFRVAAYSFKVAVISFFDTKSLAREANSDPEEWNELDAYWWLTEQPSADDQPASVYEQTFVQENGFKVMMVTYEAE